MLVTETDEIKVFNVTDVDILNEVRARLLERKKLFATVMSAMGEEQAYRCKHMEDIFYIVSGKLHMLDNVALRSSRSHLEDIHG
nr:hypothetical protein [Tanacetum cinerariifolium]